VITSSVSSWLNETLLSFLPFSFYFTGYSYSSSDYYFCYFFALPFSTFPAWFIEQVLSQLLAVLPVLAKL
jgi:hypothetical protein